LWLGTRPMRPARDGAKLEQKTNQRRSQAAAERWHREENERKMRGRQRKAEVEEGRGRGRAGFSEHDLEGWIMTWE
jgi:hypothetical protein